MSTGIVGVVREVRPDADGVCDVRHGLGTEEIVVTINACLDPDAQVGIVTPIDGDCAEVVVTTREAVRLLITPGLPVLEEPLSPAEETRRRRYGS